MGFWVSKSIKILPGVRLDISNRGVGYSVGGRRARVTRHPDGRISSTMGISRLGMSHTTTLRPAPIRAPAPPPYPSPPPVPPPPPPFPPPPPAAPAWEIDLLDALNAPGPDRFAVVARTHGRAQPDVRVLAAVLDGLWHVEHAGAGGDAGRARSLLAWAVAQGTAELAHHPFVLRHLAGRTWPVEIAGGVVAQLGPADDAVLLAVAELHQAAGDLDTAIWTVEQAQPTAPAALSLVELYSDAGRHQDVVDLTNATVNLDDATALLLVLRGRAFTHLGYHHAARESFTEALRVRERAAPVRHRALLERAGVNLAQGLREEARRDLETVLAEDAGYPGLAEALAEIG